MPYATTAQVKSYMGRLTKQVTDTSVPSNADITTFLTDRSQQIDAALKSRGLTVPVTAPAEFVAELAALNAKGAAADMMNAAFITNDTNDRGTGQILLKEFLDRIKQFYEGTGVPVGVAVAEADTAIRTNTTGLQTTFTETLSDGTVFTRTVIPGGEPFFRRRTRW